jgi:hypothetical protein
VAELAAQHPDWRVDIVGPSAEEVTNAPANLAFRGRLEPEAYTPIVRNVDVAIGTLGLYRNAMDEASPLKVREYLALGIPSIIGYDDTDFPDATSFLLRIPNRPDGVIHSKSQIEAFVERSLGTRVPREAIQHLDIRAKESARLAFIQHIAGVSRPTG